MAQDNPSPVPVHAAPVSQHGPRKAAEASSIHRSRSPADRHLKPSVLLRPPPRTLRKRSARQRGNGCEYRIGDYERRKREPCVRPSPKEPLTFPSESSPKRMAAPPKRVAAVTRNFSKIFILFRPHEGRFGEQLPPSVNIQVLLFALPVAAFPLRRLPSSVALRHVALRTSFLRGDATDRYQCATSSERSVAQSRREEYASRPLFQAPKCPFSASQPFRHPRKSTIFGF